MPAADYDEPLKGGALRFDVHYVPAYERTENQTVSPTTSARLFRPFAVSLIILLADQASKLVIARNFVPQQSIPVLPSIFHLTYVQNTGAAFGLFKGQQWIFLVCSLAVGGWIIKELARPIKLPSLIELAYALVLGGAVGNLIDRIRLSYVIDFLDFRIWPVFNVGDSAITIGVALLVFHQLFLADMRPET